MIRVGIPRSLLYYKYFPLWKSFFQNLGAEVVVSPLTNKLILDQGVKLAVDEACLPVKVYFGHVNYLKDKVDYLFAPRIVSVKKKEFTCPKFMGIPDILISNIDNLPSVIGPTIDLTKRDKNLYKKIYKVGSLFTKSPWKITLAWHEGVKELQKYNQKWFQRIIPEELNIKQTSNEQEVLNVAVLGHEYILYDPFVSMNLLQKLADFNTRVFTSEMLPEKIITEEVKNLPKRMFWNFAKDLLGSVFYFSKQKNIDGFIQVSSFGCGPDSMTGSMVFHYLKTSYNKPILNLTIDEHTGEAGINTRLEAFHDLLKRRVG